MWCDQHQMATWSSSQSSREIKPGFKSVQIFKNKVLGTGPYGKVCKAKCDDLICAAKMILSLNPHQISPQKEHCLPIRRFEQECELLSTLRHPNIVQYMGIYHDPYSRLPVLLMELMEENLTHYLEDTSHPVPYHLQVNICHDVTSALSFQFFMPIILSLGVSAVMISSLLVAVK